MPKTLALVLLVALVAVIAGAIFSRRSATADLTGDAGVIAQLRKLGSDLSKPHPVEFFLYFPTEVGANRVADKLATQGFTSTVKPAASGSSLPWHTFATLQIVPTIGAMAKLRAELSELSASEGGEYDGWGTPLVK